MSKHIILDDILRMEKQHRTNLINSLPGIRQANLIGTQSADGQTNLAIFNSVMHIGAHPPLMGFIQRPTSVKRGTYEHIKETGFFSINQVDTSGYRKAHQTSARYEVSEFDAVGLTPLYSERIPVPYVKESRVKIGLKFVYEHLIPLNQTILIVGEVQEIILEENCLNGSHIIQLDKTDAAGVNGLETYYSLNRLEELPYAKP